MRTMNTAALEHPLRRLSSRRRKYCWQSAWRAFACSSHIQIVLLFDVLHVCFSLRILADYPTVSCNRKRRKQHSQGQGSSTPAADVPRSGGGSAQERMAGSRNRQFDGRIAACMVPFRRPRVGRSTGQIAAAAHAARDANSACSHWLVGWPRCARCYAVVIGGGQSFVKLLSRPPSHGGGAAGVIEGRSLRVQKDPAPAEHM
jgi:hypothetical protein